MLIASHVCEVLIFVMPTLRFVLSGILCPLIAERGLASMQPNLPRLGASTGTYPERSEVGSCNFHGTFQVYGEQTKLQWCSRETDPNYTFRFPLCKTFAANENPYVLKDAFIHKTRQFS